MKIFLFALLVLGLLSPAVRAEDDLLQLLEGKTTDTKTAPVQMKSPLRDLITETNAEQNIFFQFVEKNDFEKALYQWPEAFQTTEFANQTNGKALFSFLLLKNNLNLVAIENLFAIENPKEINPYLTQLWRQAVPETHPVWGKAILENWKPEWTEIFGLATEVRVRGRQTFKADRFELLKELMGKTQPGSEERAWIEWQLTIALIEVDFNKAPIALAHLMKLENNPVSLDLMNMTAARLLYEKGYLDAALKYYTKVPKASEYWFEAQEEMGWANLRKGEPHNSLAFTRTLVKSEFSAIVGPEAYFQRSLSLLKLCDYPSVIGSLTDFQREFRVRTEKLNEVVNNLESTPALALLEKMKKAKIGLNSLGAISKSLPRYITRDHVLAQFLTLQVTLENEAEQAGQLYARSLAGGTAQVGYQGFLEKFKQQVQARAQAAKSSTLERVKRLAQEEITEIHQILQKMHVVEAEVLQQTMLSERTIAATAKSQEMSRIGTTGSQANDRMKFPVESELWFDELANYKVDVKNGCQATKKVE